MPNKILDEDFEKRLKNFEDSKLPKPSDTQEKDLSDDTNKDL